MSHFQYSITTKACRSLAWKTFSDWHRWNQFANIYGDVQWREGSPWEPGSRMEIEVLHPVSATIHHVITECVPARRVGWSDHALGIVMCQKVTFEEHAPGETRVQTWGEIFHSGVTIAGHTIEQLVASFIETWYENFRATCDQLAEARG